MRRSTTIAMLACASLLAGIGCSQKPDTPPGPTPQQKAELTQRVQDAYVYAYPLVIMDATRTLMTTSGSTSPGSAEVNEFAHQEKLPDPTSTGLASQSADTLYSSAWLDLAAEPVVLSIPDVRNRHYVLTMRDAWTNVFASPGKREGTRRGNYAIVAPGWTGELPRGVERIDAPTAMVWIVGRIEVNGEGDVAAVDRIQDGLELTPLSAWGKQAAKASSPAAQPAVPDPAMGAAPGGVAARAPRPKTAANIVAEMDAPAFFSRVAALLPANPAAEADAAIVATLGELGVVAGQPFAPDAALVPTMNEAAKAARESIATASAAPAGSAPPETGSAPRAGSASEAGSAPATASADGAAEAPASATGWTVDAHPASYGTDYLQRAANARSGLGASTDADRLVLVTTADADGRAFNGRFNYLLHLDKAQLPPAGAFWSVTLYNDREQFVENGLQRYAIGSRDKPQYNRDGSLDIYLQNTSPGADKERNWLPAPRGAFTLAMHVYAPKKAALDGTWTLPTVTRPK